MNTLPSLFRRAALVTVVAVATACGGDASLSSATYPLVLVAAGQGQVVTATFDGVGWTLLAPIAMDTAGYHGGGIALLRDGRSLVVLATLTGTPWYATLTGTTWSAPTAFAMNVAIGLSPPVPTDTGAVVVVDDPSVSGTLHLATFDAASSTWTSDEDTGVYSAAPAVVVPSQTGSDVVVLGASQMHSNRYAWSQRTHGTWSPAADVPGPIICLPDCFEAAVVAVRRGGTDTLVAAFATTPRLQTATFSGGTWSPSVMVATDLAGGTQPLAMTALRDGRVALAYVDSQGAVWVGFFDGTTWGPFRGIGVGVTTSLSAAAVPLALAPGRDSHAVLELVFVEVNTLAVRHVRLLDASAWTWSTPVNVGAMSGGLVGLATTPAP